MPPGAAAARSECAGGGAAAARGGGEGVAALTKRVLTQHPREGDGEQQRGAADIGVDEQLSRAAGGGSIRVAAGSVMSYCRVWRGPAVHACARWVPMQAYVRPTFVSASWCRKKWAPESLCGVGEEGSTLSPSAAGTAPTPRHQCSHHFASTTSCCRRRPAVS